MLRSVGMVRAPDLRESSTASPRRPPGASLGDALGDLSAWRGHIFETEASADGHGSVRYRMQGFAQALAEVVAKVAREVDQTL